MATEKVSINTGSHVGNTTKMFTLQTYLKKRLLMFKWEIWNRYLQRKKIAGQEHGIDIKMHQNKYTLSKYDTNDRCHLYCKKPLYYIFLFVSGFCLLFSNTCFKWHFWMASRHHVTLITLGKSTRRRHLSIIYLSHKGRHASAYFSQLVYIRYFHILSHKKVQHS